MPLSQVLVDPENGHHLALWAAKKNLLFAPKVSLKDHELLVSNSPSSCILNIFNIGCFYVSSKTNSIRVALTRCKNIQY